MSNYPENDKKNRTSSYLEISMTLSKYNKVVHKTKTLNLNHVKLYY